MVRKLDKIDFSTLERDNSLFINQEEYTVLDNKSSRYYVAEKKLEMVLELVLKIKPQLLANYYLFYFKEQPSRVIRFIHVGKKQQEINIEFISLEK